MVPSASVMSIVHRARYYSNRLVDRAADAILGIRAQEVVKLETLGVVAGDAQHYEGVPYLALGRVLHRLDIGPRDVFLDYGAGKGRAMAIAAMFPFARVLGVELMPQLARVGASNLERARTRLRCRELQLVVGDAQTYEPLRDVTVFHLFNPFVGEVLRRVLGRIRASWVDHPRPITLLFANPVHFEALLAQDPWLRLVRTVPWPLHAQEGAVPNYCYRIYRP